MKLNALLALASILIPGAAALPVLAQSVSLVASKDADGAVYVRGLTPNMPVGVTFADSQTTRNVVSNSCGGVVVRNSTTSPLPETVTVGSQTLTVSLLPTQTLPTCSGGQWSISPANNFKLVDGSVVAIGMDPNTPIAVSYAQDRVRSATANACGFIRMRTSSSFIVEGNFSIGSQTFNANTMGVTNPPLCRNGVTYLPAT